MSARDEPWPDVPQGVWSSDRVRAVLREISKQFDFNGARLAVRGTYDEDDAQEMTGEVLTYIDQCFREAGMDEDSRRYWCACTARGFKREWLAGVVERVALSRVKH